MIKNYTPILTAAPFRSLNKIAPLVLGAMLISDLSQAQISGIISRDHSFEITAASKNGLTGSRSRILNDDGEDSYIGDKRYGYFATDQFVFDNLIGLKKAYAIPDIYFDLDNAVINKDYFSLLDQISALLMDELSLRIAITAHCDSRNAAYNAGLSVRRAQAVTAYLVEKGVSADRIVIEKHGRPSTVNACLDNPGCSLDEQRINRRTEFNIIYNNVNLAHIRAYNEE